MAGGKPIGTIFVELDLDATKYTAAQKQIIAGAKTTSLAVEKNWSLIGSQSDKMYDMMRQRIENAYQQIKNNAKTTSAELIRLESMKAQRIQEINDKQFGYEKTFQDKRNAMSRDSQSGWISMMKGMIAYRVILEAIQLAHDATIGVIVKGIKVIDDFNMSVASMSAAIASGDFKGSFQDAHDTAVGLNEQIDLLDRKFIGTADELRILADSMITFGMGIDLSNQKAQDQFVAFANTIKLITRGQDFQRQAMQEVRALMQGENVQGALLVKKIEAAGYNAKQMIPIWREQGVLMEKITGLFSGYEKAGNAIERTLGAQKSTLETITNKILRTGMAQAYSDISDFVRKINDSLLTQNGLTEKGVKIVEMLQLGWDAVKTAATAVYDTFDWLDDKLTSISGKWAKIIMDSKNYVAPIEGLGGFTVTGNEPVAYNEKAAQRAENERDEALRRTFKNASLKVPGTGAKPGEDAEKLSKNVTKQLEQYGESLALFYGDAAEISKMMAEDEIKAYEARVKAREEAEHAAQKQIGQLEKLQEAQREEFEITKQIGDYYAENAYEAAMYYGNAEQALVLLNNGLAEHFQSMKDAADAVNLWQEAWEYSHMTAQGYMNQLVDATLDGFRRMEDAIVAFAMTGESTFREFANSVIANLMRIAVQRAITQPLANALGTVWPAFGGATPVPAMAGGGPVSAGGLYLVGERGPELFSPRTSGSIIPNGAAGNVTVNVVNNTGTPVNVRSSSHADAQGMVIDMVMDGISRDVHGIRSVLGGR